MRVQTRSQAMGKIARPTRDYPAPDSAAGVLLNTLKAEPGRSVNMDHLVERWGHSKISNACRDLVDYYGMDIRPVHRGHGSRYGKGKRDLWWILAGEWFGSEYRDYVNEAIDAEVNKHNNGEVEK